METTNPKVEKKSSAKRPKKTKPESTTPAKLASPSKPNQETTQPSVVPDPVSDSVQPEVQESTSAVKKIENLIVIVAKGDISYQKIGKELKLIRKDVSKLQKLCNNKDSSRRRMSDTLSGIQKPGRLSPEMYKFTGFDPLKEYSRVDVTKYICNYIKEKDLQDPTDKRQILIERDSELMHVLHFDPVTDKKLTYPLIQKYIKVHIKNEAKKKVDKTPSAGPSPSSKRPSPAKNPSPTKKA